MKIKKILTNQYVYSIFTKVFIAAIGFLNSMLLARYLGPELKGMAATALNYANIASIIITFGLQEAYPFFRKKNESPNFLSEYMTLVIVIFFVYTFIAGTIMFIIAPQIEIVASVVITIFVGYSTIVNYIALVEAPNHRNTVMVWIYIIDILILAGFYLTVPASYLVAIFLTTFVFLAQTIYYTIDLKFSFNIKLIKFNNVKEYAKFGFFPMVALLLTTLNYRADIIMLRASSLVTYAEIGIYSIGVSLAEKVFLIPNAVKEILLSRLANGKRADEVCKTIRVCWPICLATTIAIIILGRPFVNLFYGEAYENAYVTTIICVLGTVFMIFFKMISTFYVANGKQKINLILLLFSDAINVFLNSLLIPRFGTNGAAIASDVSYFICAVLFSIYFCKNEHVAIKKVICLQREDFDFMKKLRKKNEQED